MLLASNADRAERIAVEQRAQFDHLSEEVETDTYELSDQVRQYAITGAPGYAASYQNGLAALGSIEQRIARLQDAGATETELKSLRDGLQVADSLQAEQKQAIAEVANGHQEAARQLLFSADYEHGLERVAALFNQFQSMLDQRTEQAVTDAGVVTKRLRSISEAMVAATAGLFLFVLGFILKRRILKPVVTLSDVVNRLAAQDYDVETPSYDYVDEIGDMSHAIRIFRENGLERQRLEKERDHEWRIRELLARMTQRLHGCESVEDILNVVVRFVPQIAPNLAGTLYVQDDRLGLMTSLTSWLTPRSSMPSFLPDDCWALRRGQLHRPESVVDIPCKHVAAEAVGSSMCVPLTALGETIGLLCLEKTTSDFPIPAQEYLELMAEAIGLSIANIRLRDKLHEMAHSDALTSLRNRYKLQDVLHRHIAYAEESSTPLSCLMLDIDHFKSLNDRHGHEAGDLVIKEVAGIIRNAVRETEIAFRYGGEEFLVLLPEFDVVRAYERADLIRERIAALCLKYEETMIANITASVGLASYPIHASGESLIRAADAALLRAKELGRNRIIVATTRSSSTGPIESNHGSNNR